MKYIFDMSRGGKRKMRENVVNALIVMLCGLCLLVIIAAAAVLTGAGLLAFWLTEALR